MSIRLYKHLVTVNINGLADKLKTARKNEYKRKPRRGKNKV